MDKKTFLNELSRGLSRLPNKEKKVLIDFYSELIDDKIEGGQSEEQVIDSFGSINVLVERLLIENPNRKKSGCLYGAIVIILAGIIVFMGLFMVVEVVDDEIDDDRVTSFFGKAISNSKSAELTADKKGEYQIVSYNHNDVDVISLSSDTSAIIVSKSSDDKINIKFKEYDNETNKYNLKGNVLEFDNESKKYNKNKSSENRKIYLEVPDEYIGDLDLSADIGAVEMSEFNLNKLKVSTDIGSINIDDTTAKSIVLETDIGEIKISDIRATQKIELSSDIGNINFKNIDAPALEMSCDMGSITGNLLGKKEDYSIKCEVNMGKSNVSNQRGGSRSLEIETSMGSIDIEFEK